MTNHIFLGFTSPFYIFLGAMPTACYLHGDDLKSLHRLLCHSPALGELGIPGSLDVFRQPNPDPLVPKTDSHFHNAEP